MENEMKNNLPEMAKQRKNGWSTVDVDSSSSSTRLHFVEQPFLQPITVTPHSSTFTTDTWKRSLDTAPSFAAIALAPCHLICAPPCVDPARISRTQARPGSRHCTHNKDTALAREQLDLSVPA